MLSVCVSSWRTIQQVGALCVHLFHAAYDEWRQTQFSITWQTLDVTSSKCKSSILSPSTTSLIAMETYRKWSQLTLKIWCWRSNKPCQGLLVTYHFYKQVTVLLSLSWYFKKQTEKYWDVWKVNQTCNITDKK